MVVTKAVFQQGLLILQDLELGELVIFMMAIFKEKLGCISLIDLVTMTALAAIFCCRHALF